MRSAVRTAAIAVGALALTLVSSAVEGTRLEVQDWDCPPPPRSCARPVVVIGFPIPYVSDYHGISPVGSADLVGAALGMDHFHPGAFWADVLFYALVLAGIRTVWSRLRSRRRGADVAPAAERPWRVEVQ